MPYTKAGRRALPYPQKREPVDAGIVGDARPIEETLIQIMREVSDVPPWAYTYKERPEDLLEIRAYELEAILRAALSDAENRELRKHDFNCVRDWYDKNQCPHGVWWYDRHRP